ncbi:Hsp20/alpha crystallin family protein [Occultella glacieicola]|uniref:Hsp20/alpha crystallin family protein n=1 Tax=Occultella glacieicola TaxID=2518684 RepID=A0ABY2EDJ3_9MICO|nr:Hsp20/alpha crystallin family protein [Occultella glacieicola]TDE98932.1 Hsp20/alpha crystallin family protein [Occultella glacieicola]
MALTFDPFREADRLAHRTSPRVPRWMPMDLHRSGDTFVVDIDLPGVAPESIDLDVDGNTLTVQAERGSSLGDGERWIAKERATGTYRRQLSLGDGLDVDAIRADYAHGVLTLTIPVAEQAKPRKIEVRTTKPAIASTEVPVDGADDHEVAAA